MVSLKPTLILLGVLAFAGAVVPAYADVATVTVTAERPACEGVSPDEAHRLAREAEKNGAHQQAAECFLVAGENFRAHRALVRAAADTNEAARIKASAAAEKAKSQARQLRAAFR